MLPSFRSRYAAPVDFGTNFGSPLNFDSSGLLDDESAVATKVLQDTDHLDQSVDRKPNLDNHNNKRSRLSINRAFAADSESVPGSIPSTLVQSELLRPAHLDHGIKSGRRKRGFRSKRGESRRPPDDQLEMDQSDLGKIY